LETVTNHQLVNVLSCAGTKQVTDEQQQPEIPPPAACGRRGDHAEAPGSDDGADHGAQQAAGQTEHERRESDGEDHQLAGVEAEK
jgi:hypothetical protein